jgi:hypothetical protein
LNSFLIAILVGAIVVILGRLHSYYLDENERIARGMGTLDDLLTSGGRAAVGRIVIGPELSAGRWFANEMSRND